jgi:protein-tyrosine-phosphatase
MIAQPRLLRPHAVLFACGLNAVRSPMAAALLKQMTGNSLYVGSAGVRKGELDPFAVAAMDEIGIDIKGHRPITIDELDDLEGLSFDLIVTLSPEAHHRALELTRARALEIEYWPTADPTAVEGSREQRMHAYRDIREQLLRRIRRRFFPHRAGNE